MTGIKRNAAILLLQAEADGRIIEHQPHNAWTQIDLYQMTVEWIMDHLPRLRIRPAKVKKSNRRYYVYFHQINQQRYEVVAKSEHAAATKAERQWKSDYSYQTACSIEPVTDADNQ